MADQIPGRKAVERPSSPHPQEPNQLETMSGDSHKTVIKGNTSKYVKLNVGGSLHYTTIGTLVKHDTMLRAMFSGRMEVLTDSEGRFTQLLNIYISK